jgi:hypothetical protein
MRAKSSPERARNRSFALYEALGSLQQSSRAFVELLDEVAINLGRPEFEREYVATHDLRARMADVAESLTRLAEAMNAVDPQLEVHAPVLAREIQDAALSRALVLTRADEELESLENIEPADAAALSDDANRALVQLRAVTENMREFLAEEFSFRDSF